MSWRARRGAAKRCETCRLRLDDIRCSTTNPRKVFDQISLEELAKSIREHGVLQPVIVRPSNGAFELVAGERRVRAARLAGLQEIPAISEERTDAEVVEAQLVENLQRADLHPLDEADGYTRLMKAGIGAEQVAKRVGKPVKYVFERLRLMSLIAPAAALFREGKILAGHAVLLARLAPETQKLAINPDHRILFHHEDLLWDPDEKGRTKQHVKACTVGELQAWIDKHVRFDPDSQLDLRLVYPETESVVAVAREKAEKIVSIMHDSVAPPEAHDGSRIYSCRSWKRADGVNGSKTCDRSVIGVVVIGPRRGEAFRVCIDKKRCKTHWAAEMRAAKKRSEEVAKGGTKGADRYAAEQRSYEEQRKREEALRARWKKALPEILKAFADAVNKAPATASGLLADLLLSRCTHYGWSEAKTKIYIERGKTAEDLVRFLAFACIQADDWQAPSTFPKVARQFGVDVRKIIDRVAPAKAEALAAKCRK
jgi:ParB/RepB/Spo0J family partition protein